MRSWPAPVSRPFFGETRTTCSSASSRLTRRRCTTIFALIRRPMMLMLALSSLLLQASMQAPSNTNAVATGPWAGEHIVVDVSERGAHVESDCAHGQITESITLDRRGDFDVVDTFTPEHDVPVGRDENVPPVAVRYSGHVDRDTMSLAVARDKEKLGAFVLTRGSRPNPRKCR
jgi:hypothetical protein